ncbi:MAG TPA: MmcQ/YjbR family DNA-binding protein [Bacillota bacterium]|nr:MmcQ/YjbR family DNA-binding protein [Bacillota bacterium]HOL09999.1 MmcQ/YjbR family DNA-binding protein [Bacillota bacterium]HPO97748.1 MmcQ/YjbR family DNA-binding protein [Bacillota bacterium]
MRYQWLDQYCLSKKGATKDFKAEWEVTRYLIGGKMFVMVGGDQNNKPIITVKCEPSFGTMLRGQYPDIVPGYYMNKDHWNSVYIDGSVPDEVLKEMLDMSYELVLNSLSKKMIKEIIGS